MLALLLNFLGGGVITSLVNGVLNAYKAKLASLGTTEAHEVDLAKAEILGEIQMRQENAKLVLSEQGWWVTALVRPLFAYPLIAYYGTSVFACILHVPAPMSLPSPIGDWSGWIIVAYFGGRSVEKVSRIFARR